MGLRISIAAGVAALVFGAIWMAKSRDAAGNAPGRVTLKSSGATVSLGGAAKLPAWVPVYPGSSPEGVYSDGGARQARHTYSFKSADAPEKIAAYFEDRLEHGGFQVTPQIDANSGGLVSAETADKKRSVVLAVTSRNGSTQASVMAIEKK